MRNSSMKRWLVLVAVACAPVVYDVGSAEACPISPPFEVNEDLRPGLIGVPVQGVVPIYASVREDELTFPPTMTVLDPGGVEVSGSLEYVAFRAVWRSGAALTPNTTYTATLVYGMLQQVEFTFTTAASDVTPTLDISDGDLHLSESHRADEEVCCNSGESSCGGPWTECWTRTVTTEVALWGQFSVPVDAARYYLLEGEAPGARVARANAHASGEGSFSASFVERGDQYCMTIRASSLLGGADVTKLICQSSAALEFAEPFQPDQPNYGICDEPPYNPETGEEVDTGGCNSGGGGTLTLLAMLLALGLMRRRRGERGLRVS